jgi:phosphonate transport system substrate-binding protein
MPSSVRLLPLALLALFVFSSGANAQEDCPRGALDIAYCDRDGDLVADLPVDPADWADPDTLIFSYTPVEDPAVYRKVWDGFVQHLAEVTGKKAVFFPGAELRGPVRGHALGPAPHRGRQYRRQSGGRELRRVRALRHDGRGRRFLRIRNGNHRSGRQPHPVARRPERQDPGLHVPTSNSGFKAPSAILKADFGLIADEDFKTAFSGKHDNSILGVANKDYEAAAVANSVLKRMIDRKVVDPAKSVPSTNPRPFRPPDTAMRTTCIRFCPPRSDRPSSPFRGKVPTCGRNSPRKAGSSPFPTSTTGTSSARSTRPTA